MTKAIKKLLTLCAVLALSLNVVFAQSTTTNTTAKGKIVIVVLDVSGSIKKQFPDITKIIDRAIVKDRLDVEKLSIVVD